MSKWKKIEEYNEDDIDTDDVAFMPSRKAYSDYVDSFMDNVPPMLELMRDDDFKEVNGTMYYRENDSTIPDLEWTVLKYLIKGYLPKQIASIMGVSLNTINNNYIQSLKQKIHPNRNVMISMAKDHIHQWVSYHCPPFLSETERQDNHLLARFISRHIKKIEKIIQENFISES